MYQFHHLAHESLDCNPQLDEEHEEESLSSKQAL